ncbi:hypothetical protein VNO78_05018 [Psophocarpus tetragonolobus]|uniref:Uncharacterized protein n=1 Tax=Psophocarpus tetragonolobus TaxID=3891 RepID=A0AAN9ST78_PSOTE
MSLPSCKCWKRNSASQSKTLEKDKVPFEERKECALKARVKLGPQVDAVLIATGRAPFTQVLGSKNNDVATQRGFVPVDERMRAIDANGKLEYSRIYIGVERIPKEFPFLIPVYAAKSVSGLFQMLSKKFDRLSLRCLNHESESQAAGPCCTTEHVRQFSHHE